MSEHAEHDAKAPAKEPEANAPAEPEGDQPTKGGTEEPAPTNPAPPPGPAAPEPASEDPEPGWYPDPNSGDGATLRYWDGSSWTDHRSAPEGPAAAGGQGPDPAIPVGQFRTTVIPDDERRNILAQQIQMAAARGLRVENQDRYQAILVEGQPVNHVLHAILTLATCLLWGIVWAVLAATGGEKRHLITVDEYGNVTHQRLGKT